MTSSFSTRGCIFLCYCWSPSVEKALKPDYENVHNWLESQHPALEHFNMSEKLEEASELSGPNNLAGQNWDTAYNLGFRYHGFDFKLAEERLIMKGKSIPCKVNKAYEILR